jgi:hypothetical protein
MGGTVRSLYGGPLAKLAKLAVSKDLLERLANCIIKSIVEEGMKDFAKRGWKLEDPKGGPPLNESFTFSIRGNRTIEIQSSYYGLKEMTSGDIPERKMTWLTQEAKDRVPSDYTPMRSEVKAGMKRAGRVSKGERKPLVVPIERKDGTVIFRMAPLKMKDAWVHPGIAKFTFMERGIKKGREKCVKAVKEYIREQMKS